MSAYQSMDFMCVHVLLRVCINACWRSWSACWPECVICMQGQTRLSPLSPQETHISIAARTHTHTHTHTHWHTWHDQTQADRDLDKIGKSLSFSLSHSHLKPYVITDEGAYQDIRVLASAGDLHTMFKTWCYIFYLNSLQTKCAYFHYTSKVHKYTKILLDNIFQNTFFLCFWHNSSIFWIYCKRVS